MIPPKVECAVKPKPTKSEIISALVAIRIEQIESENRDRVKRRDALKAELEVEIPKLLKAESKPSRVHLGYYNGEKTTCVELSFLIETSNPSIAKKLSEFHVLSKPVREIKEKDIRREITYSVEGLETREARVEQLLDDPGSRKALEKMLKSIER